LNACTRKKSHGIDDAVETKKQFQKERGHEKKKGVSKRKPKKYTESAQCGDTQLGG